MQEYVEAIQERIDEQETSFKKHCSFLMTDAEDIKRSTRQYFQSYFEEQEEKVDKVAKICLFLTESVLLE